MKPTHAARTGRRYYNNAALIYVIAQTNTAVMSNTVILPYCFIVFVEAVAQWIA